jgi:3-phenylpropionate/trans-cinnamate dioxygenase ferredoxin subunit
MTRRQETHNFETGSRNNRRLVKVIYEAEAMSNWVSVDAVTNLPEGSVSLVDVDGTEVAVFNIGGHFYAIQDVCTHDGGTLADGEVTGFEIECPRHGARFDLRTGKVTAAPAYEDVAIFAVRIHDNHVQVRNENNGSY